MANYEIITKEQTIKLFKEFSDESNVTQILLDETDSKKLTNGRNIIKIEICSPEEDMNTIISEKNLDFSFKCCMIFGPENISMMAVENITNLIPTTESILGVQTKQDFKVIYLMNLK